MSEEICKCGHKQLNHAAGQFACGMYIKIFKGTDVPKWCNCKSFRPKSQSLSKHHKNQGFLGDSQLCESKNKEER